MINYNVTHLFFTFELRLLYATAFFIHINFSISSAISSQQLHLDDIQYNLLEVGLKRN